MHTDTIQVQGKVVMSDRPEIVIEKIELAKNKIARAQEKVKGKAAQKSLKEAQKELFECINVMRGINGYIDALEGK